MLRLKNNKGVTMSNDDYSVNIPSYLKINRIIAYILYIWVIIGVGTLTIRVFLLAFSANPDTPFVRLIYNTSTDYLSPFRGIFPSKSVGSTGYFDVSAIFAIIIYLFIMWAFSALIKYIQFKIELNIKEQEQQIKLASSKRTQRISPSSKS